jgi:hypothetical protein
MTDTSEDVAVPIPKDQAARERLANMAGLTDEERKALDAWCYEQAEEDRRRQRRGLEKHGNDVLGGGHIGGKEQPDGD